MDTYNELSPQDVYDMMKDNRIVLVDVREPQEYASERIHGALLFPLSTFDPKCLPAPTDRPIVFHCGSGKRSVTAMSICAANTIKHNAHMAGGILEWKLAGLPTITLDPTTGQIRETR